MPHIINSNFGGPLKPHNLWGALSLGISATAATPALHAMADTAATFGIPVLQVSLLLLSVVLIFWGQKKEAENLREMLREVFSDLRSEWAAQRIHEYRLKYGQKRNTCQNRPGKNRI